MNLHDWAEVIRHMSLFSAVRESKIVYPVILSTHLSCIALFGGLILVTDLRLFGFVLTRYSISTVVKELRPWKWIGLVTMVTMGVLLAGSKMTIYYDNPLFVIKISTLLLIWIHSMVFRKRVYRDQTVPAADGPKTFLIARLAGVLSLALWITVVTMGRWIAYYDRPSPYEANLNQQSSTALAVAYKHQTNQP